MLFGQRPEAKKQRFTTNVHSKWLANVEAVQLGFVLHKLHDNFTESVEWMASGAMR